MCACLQRETAAANFAGHHAWKPDRDSRTLQCSMFNVGGLNIVGPNGIDLVNLTETLIF
jgi:hypothetical protein